MAFEEPLQDLERQTVLSPSYLALMTLSGVLAAVALLTDSVPILVGSMVIAPALPPLELVALASVQRRNDLLARGVRVVVVGLVVAVGGAVSRRGY